MASLAVLFGPTSCGGSQTPSNAEALERRCYFLLGRALPFLQLSGCVAEPLGCRYQVHTCLGTQVPTYVCAFVVA